VTSASFRRWAPLALLVLAAPAEALAQSPAADLPAREAEAKRACDGGRVDEGARLLRELFVTTNDATYIFNLGRCFEQNSRVEAALSQFRTYLARKDVDPAAAAHARDFIATHEPPAAATSAPVPVAPASPAELSAVTPTTTTAAVPASPGKTLRMAGIASGALGVLGLAGGVYYGLETRRLQKEAREAVARGEENEMWVTDHNAKGEQAERLQKVLLGAGGVALAAGAVLYYFGVRADHRAQETAHAYPFLLRDGAGAALGGRF
jgi:uncharacterized protein HemX